MLKQRWTRTNIAVELERDALVKGEREGGPTPLELAPGTRLMQMVKSGCEQVGLRLMREQGLDKVWVSGADVPGEGEAKIFQFVREHVIGGHEGDRDWSIVVVTGDSDVLLMALLLIVFLVMHSALQMPIFLLIAIKCNVHLVTFQFHAYQKVSKCLDVVFVF